MKKFTKFVPFLLSFCIIPFFNMQAHAEPHPLYFDEVDMVIIDLWIAEGYFDQLPEQGSVIETNNFGEITTYHGFQLLNKMPQDNADTQVITQIICQPEYHSQEYVLMFSEAFNKAPSYYLKTRQDEINFLPKIEEFSYIKVVGRNDETATDFYASARVIVPDYTANQQRLVVAVGDEDWITTGEYESYVQEQLGDIVSSPESEKLGYFEKDLFVSDYQKNVNVSGSNGTNEIVVTASAEQTVEVDENNISILNPLSSQYVKPEESEKDAATTEIETPQEHKHKFNKALLIIPVALVGGVIFFIVSRKKK